MEYKSEKKISRTIAEFESLKEAIIDSSSFIYMEKAGYLRFAVKELKIFLIEEVVVEIGKNFLSNHAVKNFHSISHNFTNFKTDDIIINIIKSRGISPISEDRYILKSAEKANIPFFNSLMILIFLYYKNVLSFKEVKFYQNKLKQIARYSPFIWDSGEKLLSRIMEKNI